MFNVSVLSPLSTCIKIVNALNFPFIHMRVNYAILYVVLSAE